MNFGFPLQLPPMSQDLVRFLNKSFKAQEPSKYQVSLKADHPLVSYKYLIFLNYPLLLTPPKRADPVRLCQWHILDLVFILPIQFHPDLSTLSIF